jgi:chromosome segregation ATPase
MLEASRSQLEAEVRYEEKIVSKITTMQSSTSKTVVALRAELARLHSIARAACGNMAHIAKNEADLASALRIEKEKAAKFEAELLELKNKYQTVYSEHKQFSMTITQVRTAACCEQQARARLQAGAGTLVIAGHVEVASLQM